MNKNGKNTLLTLITACANSSVEDYCLDTNVSNESKQLCIDICKKLVNVVDSHKGLSMPTLVYFAVGTSAHKPSLFVKKGGYSSYDEKKVDKILSLCAIIGEKFGEKYTYLPELVHLLSRYYDVNKGDVDTLKKFLVNVDMEKFALLFGKGCRPTAKSIAKFIFGDNGIEYSKGGYITKITIGQD